MTLASKNGLPGSHSHTSPISRSRMASIAAGRQVLVELVVDAHGRRRAARGQTLDRLQGEAPIGRRLAGPDAELGADVIRHRVGAVAQIAGEPVADLDDVAARPARCGRGCRSWRCCRPRPAIQSKRFADALDGLLGQVALLLLGDIERGQQHRLLGRINQRAPTGASCKSIRLICTPHTGMKVDRDYCNVTPSEADCTSAASSACTSASNSSGLMGFDRKRSTMVRSSAGRKRSSSSLSTAEIRIRGM